MVRRRTLLMAAMHFAGIAGCGQLEHRPPAGPPPPHAPIAGASQPPVSFAGEMTAIALRKPSSVPRGAHRAAAGRGLSFTALWPRTGRFRRRFHNVQSLKHRLPQVTALDDPVASNVVFPIPSVAPQYSLMGYNPYNLTLAQQFPWFGTLRLRGEAAERDVQVALAELAAAQLDSVAAVKRAYYNLFAAVKAEEILVENRKILEDFRSIARQRLKTGGSQQDVLRAELLISELDRERANNQQAIAAARAALARQIHVPADSELADAAGASCGRPYPRSSTGSTRWRWRLAPSCRAAWRPSRATRRPSSWRRSGFTRTSPSA